MRNNTNDQTLTRNYLEKYRFLIREYELVKNKSHPLYHKAKDFYAANDTCAKSFLKYYNRYKQSGEDLDLLPQKRGPKYKSRCPLPYIEQQVIELREKGNNKYEIVNILKPKLGKFTPSSSGVYNIFRRNNINRMTPVIRKNHQKIIKERMGQLGHIDCHYLSKSIIKGQSNKLYLVCLLDDYSRVAWAELVTDITSLTVMFATLKCLNMLNDQYQIKFEEILSDNGPEFGIKSSTKNALPFH